MVGVAVATMACAASDVPQCMQNAAFCLTAPLQRGQVLVNASCPPFTAEACTGVPHSGQNFLPVTLFPQDVQVDMGFSLLRSMLYFKGCFLSPICMQCSTDYWGRKAA